MSDFENKNPEVGSKEQKKQERKRIIDFFDTRIEAVGAVIDDGDASVASKNHKTRNERAKTDLLYLNATEEPDSNAIGRRFPETLSLLASEMTMIQSDETEEANCLFMETSKKLFPKENMLFTFRTLKKMGMKVDKDFPKTSEVLKQYGNDETLERVIDDGPGVLEEIEKKIMEAFEQDQNEETMSRDGKFNLDDKGRNTAMEIMRLVYRLELLKKEAILKQKEKEALNHKNDLEKRAKTQGTVDERELKEVREKMLLDEIAKNGGVGLSMSLREGTVVDGREVIHSGFQSAKDRKNLSRFDGGISALRGSDRYLIPFLESKTQPKYYNNTREQLEVDETVILLPVEEPIMETVEEEVKASGWRGKIGGKEKRTKQVDSGRKRIASHSEMVSGGKNEPAVSFRYCAEPFKRHKQNDNTGYRDCSGRTGQHLGLECILPKSVADELAVKLREDPAFARKVVESLMIGKMGIDEEMWKGGKGNGGYPLRPPYEAWSETKGGSKMYVNLLERQEDLDDKVGKIVEV